MRADAHYVDQLDTRSTGTVIRPIPLELIDLDAAALEPLTPAFIDTVRRLGVLQPLLVAAHHSRYRIISGRRRLAAARAAGLVAVPCIVHHVDSHGAEEMALSSNVPATRPRTAPGNVTTLDTPALTAELTDVVAALVSCTELLGSPSTLTQVAAMDLVRAEANRALDALVCLRVLRDEMPVSRAPIAVQSLLERLATAGALERQIRGIALHVDVAADARAAVITADARLLATGVSALVSATASVVESAGPARRGSDAAPATIVRLRCARAIRHLELWIAQNAVELPDAWLGRPFDVAWPVRNGVATLTQLRAARRIAEAHGGHLTAERRDEATGFVMALPVMAAS